MANVQQLAPRSIKSLSIVEKAQWPVSVAIAADGNQIIVSRYGDTIWDFWPYVPQENKPDSHKRINWAIKLGNGDLLTNPQHAALLESCKDFVWSLFADPIEGRKRPKMATIISVLKQPIPTLVRWMVGRGLSQFHQLAECSLDYVIHAKQGVSPKTACSRLAVLEDIYHQSQKIADGLPSHPWEFETAAGLSGAATMPDRYKAKTPVIPAPILKHLAALAIDYVERRADGILNARDAINAAGGNQMWIGEQRASTVVAQEYGFPSARAHSKELILLKTACYIVIAMFSGIRDSELLSLGAGCITRHPTQDGIEARWLHGTIYKTGYRPKKWLVPPIVETAVRVMVRFSAPMRNALAAEEQALREIGSQEQAFIKRRHKVQNQQEKLFLAPDSKLGNQLSVMSGGTAGTLLKAFSKRFDILDDNGKPWPLAPHQFRRTFAYNYAKSQMGDLLYLQEHFGHHSLDMTLLYSGEGADDYEGDTELLEMIAKAKHDRQVKILKGVVESDAPLAAGGQWIGDWRRTIRTAKNKEQLIEELSGTLSLTGTGHSWCAGSAKGTGCGSRCMFEPDMCTECDWAIISQEHLPVWREIAAQQESILACDDIGAPGQALAKRVLAKAKTTIATLERPTQ
jgi:integrase